jgi:hypothetical protein
MVHMRIRRVNLRSMGKHGCLLGTVLAALPSLVCGLVLVLGAYLAQRWIEGWQVQHISVLGQELARIDLVRALGLERLMETLHQVSTASPFVVLMAVVWLALLSGLLAAALVMLAGLAYNGLASLTGGIIVEVSTRPERERGPRPEKPGQPRP